MSGAAALRGALRPIRGEAHDYDPLIDLIGDAQVVLLGESTHGTHEFYRERARITERLVREHGFSAVAVEADWPDANRVNRWIRGDGADSSARDALASFERFPTWMWRNADVLRFVERLRALNDARPAGDRVGFYGLDLYSMYGSIDAVLEYLDRTDAAAAGRARYRYGCFEQFGEDSQAYGYAAEFGLTESCEQEAVAQLVELQRSAGSYGAAAGDDERFYAEQNARLVRNAEEYYRTMFRGRVSSWNLRDRHMVETLEALIAHLAVPAGGRPRVVIWAHNSHLGDARATEMGAAGEWNVGQLVRERFGDAAVLVGLTTFDGTVTAASDWGGDAELKGVLPALPGSIEAVLHAAGEPAFVLPLTDEPVRALLAERRLERAIGVIYRPESERASHYFHARVAEQFDALLHFDTTSAVEPLDPGPRWRSGLVPDTYPTGL